MITIQNIDKIENQWIGDWQIAKVLEIEDMYVFSLIKHITIVNPINYNTSGSLEYKTIHLNRIKDDGYGEYGITTNDLPMWWYVNIQIIRSPLLLLPEMARLLNASKITIF